MADELQLTYQGAAATLYAVVRRPSDQYVWDATAAAWEAWADGSIGDYDLPLTDDGGDLYTADFPTGIASGTTVRIMYYIQAGASPAITDLVIRSEVYLWTGVLTASESITLDARALTSLASVKRWLRITATTDDTLLTELINMVSDRIERVCGRRFAAANYRQWISGSRQESLRLRHYPVINMTRVGYGSTQALSVVYSGTAVRATVDVYGDEDWSTAASCGCRCVSTTAAGTTTTNDLDFSTYPTASTLATAITALTGWTATLLEECLSLDLHPDAGGDAENVTAYLTYPGEDDHTGRYDRRTGLVTFVRGNAPGFGDADDAALHAPSGHQNVLVQYRAGYATLPDDINLLANQLVAGAYHEGKTNPQLASESLGDYSYSLGNQVQMTDGQMAILGPYREIV